MRATVPTAWVVKKRHRPDHGRRNGAPWVPMARESRRDIGRRGPETVRTGMWLLERRTYASGARYTLWAVSSARRSRGGAIRATLVTYAPYKTRQRILTFKDGEVSGAFRPFTFTQDDYANMWASAG